MGIESAANRGSEDGVLCPKCLLANSPGAAFCTDCGAPIGMVATIDPIQHIHAEGFAYRSAVDGPPNRIVLAGMWLLFGPAVLIGPGMLFNSPGANLPATTVFNLVSACALIVLFRT